MAILRTTLIAAVLLTVELGWFLESEMKSCKCGSYAINENSHGRTPGVDIDLCDVCYWRTRANYRQAQIDAMMLEYCPDEMTPYQLQEWAEHQKPVPPNAAIKEAYEQGKRDAVPEFVYAFKRHVGGDGEFWLHELEDFAEAPKQENSNG